MYIKNNDGRNLEIELEKLVEIVADEVAKQLLSKDNKPDYPAGNYGHECSCRPKGFNPSCCSVTEISREYILSIRREASSIMAL